MRDLKVGQRFKVVGFEQGPSIYRQKLLAMGLTRGVEGQVIKVAPFGDPIQIKIRGYNLSLRRDESSILQVEVVE